MRIDRRLLIPSLGLILCNAAHAAGPTCGVNETLVSWPAGNPVWELCYLRPSVSSGPRGSGLELRNVYYNGRLALKRAHSPILFAEYTTSTCYRDWKDTDSQQIVWASRHPAFNRVSTTSCDRSKDPIASYGTCPFSLITNGSDGNPTGSCQTGVTVEDFGTYVELSTQYNAAWYQYSSRFRLYADGSFEPEFGFGNSNGTNNNITHWHHNYWRLDFDIEGAENDRILENGVVQALEFATRRCDPSTSPSCAQERRWRIEDRVTGRGFELNPADADYITPTNQSGRNFHLRDVIGTVYNANEYSDRADNSLGDCGMVDSNLANGQDLDGVSSEGTDVVLYYRAGVRDRTNEGLGTQDSMVCKRVGPMFTPVGTWTPSMFDNSFE
jgi:hypothetical protein